MILLHNARLVRRGQVVEGGWLTVADGLIAEVGDPHQGPASPSLSPSQDGGPGLERIDLAGHYLLPGFVDMHTHGGAGASFGAADADQVQIAADYHLSHGTTTLLASTVTSPLEDLERQLPVLADLTTEGVLAGIHLEGPYLSAARCGAHDPALLRSPEPGELARLLKAGRGAVRMVTLAPELDHALAAIRLLVERGVVPALGHTDATYTQTRDAIDAGARVATHSFNGMRPIDHREPGPMIAVMERDEVVLEVINDGVHVHPAVVRHLFSSVGTRRVALISDAMSAAGAPDGDYQLGPMTVTVTDGVARTPTSADGTPGGIAGSTITVWQALRNAVLEVGIPIGQAAVSASLTPARALGLADRIGSLKPGKDADLVVLDQALAVVAVVRKGRFVSAE